MKRALVVGSGGQDGTLLTERLSSDGLTVLGVTRRGIFEHGASTPPLVSVDLTNARDVSALIERVSPDEIYYLAAHHHSSEDAAQSDESDLFRKSSETNLQGLLNVLEAARRSAPGVRIFYAASSHVFGTPTSPTQSEVTPFDPRTAYAITKAAGVYTCRAYRDRGVFASVGILYNHESRFRADKFVSKRIVRGAREAKMAVRDGRPYTLKLGDLSAIVDWGYAPDYVDAMVRIARHHDAGDWVVATGEPHTVRDFAEAAFAHEGLDWQNHVQQDGTVPLRRNPPLIGDASKLRNATGWRPTVSFREMVLLLLQGLE